MARTASGNRFPVEKMIYRTVKLHTIRAILWDGEKGETSEITIENAYGKTAERIVKNSLNPNEKLLKVMEDHVEEKIAYMEIDKFLKLCSFRDVNKEPMESSYPDPAQINMDGALIY